MKKRASPEESLTGLILQIFRVNGQLLTAGDRLTKKLGLTSARWQILGALADGRLTASQIARKMGLKRQSVQRLVDLLEREKIVELSRNPDHRVAMLVSLTAKGERKFAQISKIQADWAGRLAQGLSAADLNAAIDLLQTLQTRLEQSQ
jgi:DNA-binding MarR family transcriptional regulator